MSRGYRCAVFAAFGWLALCGAQPPAEQFKGGDSAAKSAPAAQPTATPTPTPTATPSPNFTAYPGYNPDPCYHAKDHDAADLCAQWRASMAAEKATHEARRATNWSIVATFLSALSLVAVAYALKLTVDSNGIARASQRAWVRLSIRPVAIGKGDPDGLNFEIDVMAENLGETVATHFDFEAAVLFKAQENGFDRLNDDIDRQIKEWTDAYDASFNAALLPNDTQIDTINETIRHSDINWWQGVGFGGGSAQPVVLAAVFYRTVNKPNTVQLGWRTWFVSKKSVRSWHFVPSFPYGTLGEDDLRVDACNAAHMHIEFPAMLKKSLRTANDDERDDAD